jgi:CMP-N-acetylneuraminic acid synthetase
MSIIAFIFARGGSKGLPGKNIRVFAGKPLIAWSIEHAEAIDRIDRVIVSTDSIEIAEVAKKYGAEVPFIRPTEFAKDDSPEWLAWRHALNYVHKTSGKLPRIMISVPTTSPLRLPIDIENCLDEYEKKNSDVVITVTDAHRNPYFNMVKINSDGNAHLVNPRISRVFRRQDAPVVYDLTTVCYVVNPEFVMRNESIFDGRVRAVHVPTERAIDIDNILDFHVAESLMNLRTKET